MFRFRREVLPFIAAAAVAGGLILLVARPLTGSWCVATCLGLTFFLVATLYFLYFFRDPERTPPTDKDAIVTAGEGRVASITDFSAEAFLTLCKKSGLDPAVLGDFTKLPATRISVFLSPLNVHVNRAPIAGQSRFLGYFPGKHIFTGNDKSSEENQHNAILIENERTRCLLFQIVGPVCRRVVYWPDHDQAVPVSQG
ncbi:MAG: phosphatidylserine decarboxylase, partial [Verrucomicrobia bacterium]|nr:phosphatidylserine decarboxylase [Verrucomicrobiota bacterium]